MLPDTKQVRQEPAPEEPPPSTLSATAASWAARWGTFLQDYYLQEIRDLVAGWAQNGAQTVTVSFEDLQLRDPDLANDLLAQPQNVLRVATSSLWAICDQEGGAQMPVLQRPRPRLLGIRDLPEALRISPRQVNAALVRRLVPIQGVVTAQSEKRLVTVTEATFQCKVCTTRSTVIQDDQDEQLVHPVICETCDAERPWQLVDERLVDKEILRVQEFPEGLEGGQTPATLTVRLHNDLVGRAPAGSRVIITGVVLLKFRKENGKYKTEAEPFLEGVNVEIDTSDAVRLEHPPGELEAFQDLADQDDVHVQLARCIAPSVAGLEDVKMGILYALAGAPKLQAADGSTLRGRIHVLIAGDRGVAKSKLLGRIPSYVPRCVNVFGLNANRVGLGAAVVKDPINDEHMIEPGALVLAHRSVCTIDELNLILPEDRPALNEAMEEGTVTVSKVKKGKLPAEATIIANMNPASQRFDGYSSYIEQLGLEDALRSRFDLVWCIRDLVDKQRDRLLADRQLAPQAQGSVQDVYAVPLDGDQLRRYLHHARTINPQLGTEARERLANYYEAVRQSDIENPPFTARQLDGLRRLAAASARLRLADEVLLEDAERAVALMQASLKSCKIMAPDGRIDGHLLQTGTSKSQHDRVRLVLQLIKDLVRASENGYHRGYVQEDVVVKAALGQGLTDEEARAALKALIHNGSAYHRGGAGTYAPLSG